MRKQSIHLLFGTLFLISLASMPVGAQTAKRLLDKETFMDMESVGTPAFRQTANGWFLLAHGLIK